MSNSNNPNYEYIDRPYGVYMDRSTLDIGDPTSSSASQDSGVTPGSGGNALTNNPGSTEVNDGSIDNGSVETQPVKSDGGMADLWIRNMIRSDNWKPKKVGFYIDGQTGYAEFTNVYVSGNIQALTGSIGGWIIGANTISSTGVTLTSGAAASLSFGATPPTGPALGTGIFIDKTGLFGLSANTQNFKIDATNGYITAIAGTVGGCALGVSSIGSTTFVSGPLGSGWNISNTGTAEFQNVSIRGVIKSTVFEKNTVSAINGELLVSKSDVLSADMTALDSSTLTISGESSFAVNEVVEMKDGINDEYMLVTNITSAPTYIVTRDLAGTYAPNTNPIWKKGTAVVSIGSGNATGNLAPNPSFETWTAGAGGPPDGWTGNNLFGPGNAITRSTDKISGAYAAQFVSSSSGDTRMGRFNIALVTGTTYYFSAWVKHVSGAGKAMFWVVFDTNITTSLTLTSSYAFYQWSVTYTGASGAGFIDFGTVTSNDTLLMDDVFISSSPSMNTGYILLDSSSTYSPFIDIYGRNSSTYTDVTLHARLGWLKGITDADVGLASTDVWGLYTDNAYLKGTIVANAGYIGGTTGWTIATGYIKKDTGVENTSAGLAPADWPFYAGAQYASRATAPFRVSPAGILYATGANVSGTITASAGTIGGFAVGSDYIKDSNDLFGMASTVSAGTDIRFWAGDTFANRAIAPFNVDENGNVVAKSLRRQDYHWFTCFEGITGYGSFDTGTSSHSNESAGLRLLTGTTSGSRAEVFKGPSGSNIPFTWGKKRSFKTTVNHINVNNSPIFFVGTGYEATSPHFAFTATGAAIHATNANGTTETNTDLGVNFSAGTPVLLEAFFDPGVSVKYYINGVLKATVTTNIPSTGDEAASYDIFLATLKNASAADRNVIINYYDFWQAV